MASERVGEKIYRCACDTVSVDGGVIGEPDGETGRDDRVGCMRQASSIYRYERFFTFEDLTDTI